MDALEDCTRAAATVEFALNGDNVAVPLRGHVAQGVLPDSAVAEVKVDVAASAKARQVPTVRIHDLVGANVLGEVVRRPHSHQKPVRPETLQLFRTEFALGG